MSMDECVLIKLYLQMQDYIYPMNGTLCTHYKLVKNIMNMRKY